MTNTKSTKRALWASVLSIVICLTMLIGSTFAWFTDSATTGVNTIVSGNLDIVLEYWDGDSWENAENTELNFIAKDGNKNILWEPGCTYELPKIRVRNLGNLNAQVLLRINGIRGDEKLFEALEFKNAVGNIPTSILNGSQASTYNKFEGKSFDIIWNTPDGNVIFDWPLAAKNQVTPNSGHTDTSAEFTISAHMKETADNDYQNLKMEGISIQVLAKQDVYEYDSYGRDYDKNAEYPTIEEKLVVTDNDTLAKAIESKADYTVEQGEYSNVVVADGVNVTVNGGNFSNQIIAARNGGTVTIKNASGRTGNSGQAVIANVNSESTVIFEGGNYPLFNSLLSGDGTGTVVITGGYFDGGCFYWNMGTKPVANLTITGGTFGSNFVYMSSMMGPAISTFVPDTHQIINNADGSCTVVAK